MRKLMMLLASFTLVLVFAGCTASTANMQGCESGKCNVAKKADCPNGTCVMKKQMCPGGKCAMKQQTCPNGKCMMKEEKASCDCKKGGECKCPAGKCTCAVKSQKMSCGAGKCGSGMMKKGSCGAGKCGGNK